LGFIPLNPPYQGDFKPLICLFSPFERGARGDFVTCVYTVAIKGGLGGIKSTYFLAASLNLPGVWGGLISVRVQSQL
jgi:hypothetical protein